MASLDARAKWIEAGLAELAKGGVEAVRVEVIAQRLGVTKGGFYWNFKDRRDLLDAILKTWREGRIEAIQRQTAPSDKSPKIQLEELIQLYSERVSAQGMAIELAVRQWARADKPAAAAVASVDAARLKHVAGLFQRLGLERKDAEVRALMFYAFVFGQSLLFLRQAAEERRAMNAACARLLIENAPAGT